MAKTYVPLATQTLGSAAASVTFSSISGAYTDLVLVCTGKTSNIEYPYLQFNSDTATNYSDTHLYGDGSSAGSLRRSSVTATRIAWSGYPMTTDGWISTCHIMNYANSTTNKTVLTRANMVGNGTSAIVGLWRSTAAITSIKVLMGSTDTFAIGSIFSLYGLAAA